MIDNAENIINARRLICGNIHETLTQFLAAADKEDLPQALAFCGMANREGGVSEEELARVFGWFLEIVKRGAVLAEYLTGRVDVQIDEQMEVSLQVTEILRDYVGKDESGNEKSAADAVRFLEEHGGWCGGHVERAQA
jgi:hypothetical protein